MLLQMHVLLHFWKLVNPPEPMTFLIDSEAHFHKRCGEVSLSQPTLAKPHGLGVKTLGQLAHVVGSPEDRARGAVAKKGEDADGWVGSCPHFSESDSPLMGNTIWFRA